MIEAVMFWNEPNNKSHWAFEVDPEWRTFAHMTKVAAEAVAAENPRLLRVLGGISPIDPMFITNMRAQGVLDHLDVVAVHGFPLDWNHWNINEWPDKLKEIQDVTDLPVWVSEVGASSFGAEEVQEFGLRRMAELLRGRAERIHWYSLYDLPRAWPATTRHREAEGSSYYRHFYMGLLREDGTAKLALEPFAEYTPDLGICQWFNFEDHRLDDAVLWLRRLGVKYLRTGLSWADSLRPQAIDWFDRQMRALEEFELTLTFCFTPESCGVFPHYTSPPQRVEEFADFCVRMVRRYAPSAPAQARPYQAEVIPAHHDGQQWPLAACSPSGRTATVGGAEGRAATPPSKATQPRRRRRRGTERAGEHQHREP
jgi:beta-xylosidase